MYVEVTMQSQEDVLTSRSGEELLYWRVVGTYADLICEAPFTGDVICAAQRSGPRKTTQ